MDSTCVPPNSSAPALLAALLFGENPVRSSPLKTLASALGVHGINCTTLAPIQLCDTRGWLSQARAHDIGIFLNYGDAWAYFARQLSLAAAAGLPLVRWWVGSDVLNCIENPDVARVARKIDKCVVSNVAVAKHLVDELGTIGIAAQLVPSVVENDSAVDTAVVPGCERSLLVYLPSTRLEFYCASTIRHVIKDNPDLCFVIVADETHSLADLPNVKSVGWVADMNTIWRQVGGLLRVTMHDGMPRMILDALRRGRFVVYCNEFLGCERASSVLEINVALRKFRSVTIPDESAVIAAAQVMNPPPGALFRNVVLDSIRSGSVCRRARAAVVAIESAFATKLDSRRRSTAPVTKRGEL